MMPKSDIFMEYTPKYQEIATWNVGVAAFIFVSVGKIPAERRDPGAGSFRLLCRNKRPEPVHNEHNRPQQA
ncbi:MAG: hypothetical protein LBR10_07720 [Prevotellaceae bacterium]|jgi:hypothetical protein|nr:hypothetical protein [Prevotellaceae bacterium]